MEQEKKTQKKEKQPAKPAKPASETPKQEEPKQEATPVPQPQQQPEPEHIKTVVNQIKGPTILGSIDLSLIQNNKTGAKKDGCRQKTEIILGYL